MEADTTTSDTQHRVLPNKESSLCQTRGIHGRYAPNFDMILQAETDWAKA